MHTHTHTHTHKHTSTHTHTHTQSSGKMKIIITFCSSSLNLPRNADWEKSICSHNFVAHESTPPVLICGVLQGSVLGPLLFTLYTYPLSTITCQSGLSYNFFADDSKLHKSSVPSDFPVLACCLKDCIEDVAEWMGDSKLKMNGDKTEFMAIDTRPKLSQVIPNPTTMSISGCDIPFSQSVRNLGFHLDETLFMDVHIKYLCCNLFCQMPRIGKNPLLPVH